MDPNDHVRLMAMIQQAENKHSYICNHVDPEVLWDFFFETGFIYPKKYAFILPYKEEIKRNYEKLYSCQSAVTRHFTWQNNGTIVAHLAMLRFYEKTWMLHHLAARTEKETGGRMLDALDLAVDKSLHSKSDLSDQYHEIGLWRERRVFALRLGNKLKAVIMANISDFALNLSDHIFILLQTFLNAANLFRAFVQHSGKATEKIGRKTERLFPDFIVFHAEIKQNLRGLFPDPLY